MLKLIKKISVLIFICLLQIYFSCISPENTQNQNTQEPEKNLLEQNAAEADSSKENFADDKEENQEKIEVIQEEKKDYSLKITFGGDIMAHKPNYLIDDFSKIWSGIKDCLADSDLNIANLEAPVAQELGFDTYPTFNMEESYPNAAIDAGWNVFSLANNHTNDKFLKGIQGTFDYFSRLEALNEKKPEGQRKIYACGIKNKANGELTYRIIECKEWKILFVAITEILNRPNSQEYIDYISPTAAAREKFKKEIIALKEKANCDFFILSVHSSEEEYKASIPESRRTWYKELLDCGADVVFANHPHVTRAWEFYGDEEDFTNRKLVMYGLGNVISAQRTDPCFENPAKPRDDTGDGVLVHITIDKDKDNKPYIKNTSHTYITTYKTPEAKYIIKVLDDNLIKEFEDAGNLKQANYFKARKKITSKFKGTTLWQTTQK